MTSAVEGGAVLHLHGNDLTTLFSYSSDPDHVVVDLSGSHIWDASTIAALDAIEAKYQALEKSVETVGALSGRTVELRLVHAHTRDARYTQDSATTGCKEVAADSAAKTASGSSLLNVATPHPAPRSTTGQRIIS